MATETATESPLTPQQERMLERVEREVAKLAKENEKRIERVLASRARRGL